MYSAPVVSDGRLFVGDRAGSIHCLDAPSGARLWTSDVAESSMNSTVLVVDDRVIGGTNNGTAVGVDVTTGSVAWRIKIDGRSIREVLAHGGGALVQTESLWQLDPRDGSVQVRYSWSPQRWPATSSWCCSITKSWWD